MKRLNLQPIEIAGIVACVALYVVILIIAGVRDSGLDPVAALFVGIVMVVSTALSVFLWRGLRRLLASMTRRAR